MNASVISDGYRVRDMVLDLDLLEKTATQMQGRNAEDPQNQHMWMHIASPECVQRLVELARELRDLKQGAVPAESCITLPIVDANPVG